MDGLANNGDLRSLDSIEQCCDGKNRRRSPQQNPTTVASANQIEPQYVSRWSPDPIGQRSSQPDFWQLSENERNNRHRSLQQRPPTTNPTDRSVRRTDTVARATAGQNSTDGFSPVLEFERGQERRVATVHPSPSSSSSGQTHTRGGGGGGRGGGNEIAAAAAAAAGQANETKPRAAYDNAAGDVDKTTGGKDDWGRYATGVKADDDTNGTGHGFGHTTAPPSSQQQQQQQQQQPTAPANNDEFDRFIDDLLREDDIKPTEECVERNRQQKLASRRERDRQKTAAARKTKQEATAEVRSSLRGKSKTVDRNKRSDEKRNGDKRAATGVKTRASQIVANNSGQTPTKRPRRQQQPSVAKDDGDDDDDDDDGVVGRGERERVMRNMKFVTFYMCDACLENLKTMFLNARSNNFQLYLCHECTDSNYATNGIAAASGCRNK